MLYVTKREKWREWLEKFHDKERARRLIKHGKMTKAGLAVLGSIFSK